MIKEKPYQLYKYTERLWQSQDFPNSLLLPLRLKRQKAIHFQSIKYTYQLNRFVLLSNMVIFLPFIWATPTFSSLPFGFRSFLHWFIRLSCQLSGLSHHLLLDILLLGWLQSLLYVSHLNDITEKVVFWWLLLKTIVINMTG